MDQIIRAGIHDRYVLNVAADQNAINLVEGWSCAFPEHIPVTAGPIVVYDDARIHWCLEQLGGTHGMRMLELGPLEGSHTYMLCNSRFGHPESVLSIEANELAFMKCLIAKNLLGMDRAKFMLGDFIEFLGQHESTFDFILASGVLYHMTDPVGLLESLSKRTKRLFLWTHYFDHALLSDIAEGLAPFSGKVWHRPFLGQEIPLHERSYLNAAALANFCGGYNPLHHWMERDDIIKVLRMLGFSDIRTTMDHHSHIHGPCFCVYAAK